MTTMTLPTARHRAQPAPHAAQETAYVVSFAPSTEINAFGGFYWWPDLAPAVEFYESEVRDSATEGGSHIVRLLAVAVTGDPRGDDATRDEITADLDGDRLDELEVTAPALRQYVPAGTEADRVPTGGVDRDGRGALFAEM